MALIKIDYYRSNEDLEYNRFFSVDDVTLSWLRKFINDEKIILEYDDKLSIFIRQNIKSESSRESLCCQYITDNYQEIFFDSSNSFTTNMN
jgi:hypothetical protein